MSPQALEERIRMLVRMCPKGFYDSNNSWSSYVAALLSRGGVTEELNWKWKRSSSDIERTRQRRNLSEVLTEEMLVPSNRRAIAGWMLSEMLAEVPVNF